MYHVVYVSCASYDFSNEDLTAILTKSRLNNSGLGITGILLYNMASILQVLEGEREQVLERYRIITQDSRHKGVIKLVEGHIAERNFAEWSMTFKKVSDHDWSTLQGYLDPSKRYIFSPTSVDSQCIEIITLMKTFSDVNKLNMSFAV